MDPIPSPLLTLPPELRNQILETLFFGAELSTLCKYHRPNPFQRANYGILAANKQLNREASNILFHGAILRIGIAQSPQGYLPSLMTRTVIPTWSWYIRDKYRDRGGIDLEFLQPWQGLRRVRHVEIELYSDFTQGGIPGVTTESLWQYTKGCEMVVDFLNGLPDIESLIIDTDVDGFPWLEECKKKLREVTSAKLVTLGMGDCCGLHPFL